jgi:hypothetical protein
MVQGQVDDDHYRKRYGAGDRSLARIEASLHTDASITLLVNNADVGAAAPLHDSDIDKMDDMIPLDVTALTRLTRVPRFVAPEGRHNHQHHVHRWCRAGNPELRCGRWPARSEFIGLTAKSPSGRCGR